ncbi:DoxX family protein [Streptomyces avicenniae]|uniref:DoxX family protein n=1 Tax=Streptomyces avicenniae TaxID=500153 RepID=UPI00069AD01A|nr:DoxX family protein [Streptomyces avicenniae]
MSVTPRIGGPPPVHTRLSGVPVPGRQEAARESTARFAPLPLRVFLGVTFLYAGIDKFSDARPFSGTMNAGAVERLVAVTRENAALPRLSDLLLDRPELFAACVGSAEIAIGAAVLLGMLTRWAAAGGALLTLAFWLTTGWHADPFYFGHDLPYALGFVTLLLTGAGTHALGPALTRRQDRRSRRLFARPS